MKDIKSIGRRWERELANELNGKRQPNSGAFGTQHDEPTMTGDVVVKYPWLNKGIQIEAKYGYGGSESMTIKREWFTKAKMEADRARRYPAVALKFRDVTSDRETAKIICFNLDTWLAMVKEIEYLYLELLARIKEDFNGKEIKDECIR